MKLQVKYCEKLSGVVQAPPSKNYTTRYILAACLAEGTSIVYNASRNDDAQALMECCRQLGAEITVSGEKLVIRGFGRKPRTPEQPLNPHNAGAVLRFLLGIGALLPEVKFVTDFPDSLGRRPNQPLLEALAQLGVRSESNAGCLPITLYGGKLHGGKVTVSGKISSQFISSLLFLAPLIGESVEIEIVDELKSAPAVRQTLEVLNKAGVIVERTKDLRKFYIAGGQSYRAGEFYVNGDYPGAAALLSAAAVCPESDVTVTGLYEDEQGERAAVGVLREMGAEIEQGEDYVRVRGGAPLRGVEFDGDKATDAVLALVGAACLATGRSRFYNVENLRYKECNRIDDPVRELKKIGVAVEGRQREIIVNGNPAGYDGGIEVSSYDDHRVIMLLTIVGLRCSYGLTILNAEHISKSYPEFFAHLSALGAKFEKIN